MDEKPNPYMGASDGAASPPVPPPPPPSPPPGPNSDAQPGPTEPTDSAAKMMVDQLIKLNYHPVIMCGTSGAGKTTTLASLCAYLRLNKEFNVEFGPWPTSGKSAVEGRRLNDAQQFYETKVYEFMNGLGPEASGAALPYIVPVEVTPTRNAAAKVNPTNQNVEPVRLAFMDMGGELFKPDSEDNPTSNKLSDVEKLLFLYPKGVSVMFLGPPTRKDGYSGKGEEHEPEIWQQGSAFQRRREHPDTALRSALRAYNNRSTKRGDRLLFLLTKWDLVVGGVDSEAFLVPDRQMVEEELSSRFPESWAAFSSMRVNAQAKWLMQYCAGVMQGRSVMTFKQGTEQREALDRYAKVMWNWLYRGATRDARCPEGLLLFPELIAPKPTGLAARFAQGLSR